MPRGIYPRTPEGRANIAAARRGTKLSETTKARVREAAIRNAADPEWRRKVADGTRAGQAAMTPEERKSWNQNKSLVRIGTHPSEETKAKLAKTAAHSYRGGATGDAYAAVLCPAGYTREHHFTYGEPDVSTGWGLRRPRFQMDFAHLEAKVDIELDGIGHKASPEEDAARDAILRLYGWKVIRIKY